MLVEIRSTRQAWLANNPTVNVGSCPQPTMSTTTPARLPSQTLRDRLSELFSENDPPKRFPETVPQIGPNYGQYQSRNIDFWTCGFFAGSLYSLLERAIKYPHTIKLDNPDIDLPKLRRRLQVLAQAWSDPIHGESRLTNTHDLGFIQMPHMRPRWELFHDEKALNTILTAAKSLHTRFNPVVGAIRSWDQLTWLKIPPNVGMDDNFIVIIDSMCNLDLLFYAAAHSGDKQLADAAIAHARTLMKSHLRLEPPEPEQRFPGSLYSTFHVVNFSPITGEIKGRCTAQGYSTSSTWSRGQAWAILGYAQTYVWTGEREFLETACGLAEYLLLRLEKAPAEVEVPAPDGSERKIGRYVPVWDFDAPIDDGEPPLRDTSAGTAAANGLLILAQSLAGQGLHDLSDRFLQGGLRIVGETLEFSLADEKARLDIGTNGELTGIDAVGGECFESVLKNATVCNNPMSNHRMKDHGLVYADYYLVEFGTRLLRMGLV
ncbi:Unsaturated glucuronyl hydrolase [Colletotrichum gloeosporioides]|uniref:Unsaturated glucuronyl hydrolase n=1 Tax=Colletotrichum gloeosporioides TaxID=474922 RepID=A0A8H4CU34_COLGL|nr:Unsaturated glucuronyl hydrolase [Colletotrichum gloeosporioides]KAF3809821.1 Unsaturated glucuronyl hydrolase [Colletotrichum gloeosporioides]